MTKKQTIPSIPFDAIKITRGENSIDPDATKIHRTVKADGFDIKEVARNVLNKKQKQSPELTIGPARIVHSAISPELYSQFSQWLAQLHKENGIQ